VFTEKLSIIAETAVGKEFVNTIKTNQDAESVEVPRSVNTIG